MFVAIKTLLSRILISGMKVKQTEKGYEVTVKRVVEIGMNYRISGSYGYDIQSGVVIVSEIGSYESMTEFSAAFYEAETQSMSAEEKKEVCYLLDEPWVMYKYRNGDVEVLPIRYFVEHISRV